MSPQVVPTAPIPYPTECRRDRELECRLAKLADGGPQAIADRLGQLDREWTAGRMTKVTLGAVILFGFAMTALFNNLWWLILPAVAALFLVQYAVSRTSWLTAMFREMGYPSRCEVDQERIALRALRGDFRHLPTLHDIEAKDDISRLEGEGGIVVEPDAHKVDPHEAVKEVIEAAKH